MRNTFKTFLCMLTVMCSLQIASAYDAAWEAIESYNGVANDLSATIDEGQNFSDAIDDYSGGLWDTAFAFTNNAAWESDFKDDSLGGNDTSYIDAVDLALFTGHGNTGYFLFSTQNDDYYLTYNDALWGNNDLEWIIVDACKVLYNGDSGVWSRWEPAFSGLHYILGYHSVCYDYDTRGELFIKYAMDDGDTVRTAWITATTVSESGTTAAYLRGEDGSSDTYYDHLWGFGTVSSDPNPVTTTWYSSWGT